MLARLWSVGRGVGRHTIIIPCDELHTNIIVSTLRHRHCSPIFLQIKVTQRFLLEGRIPKYSICALIYP